MRMCWHRLLKKIKSILNTKTFYFAENYDITQCAQSMPHTQTNTHSILPYLESRWVAVIGGSTDIARLDTEARAAGMLHNTNVAERANRRFFFNEHLLHPLIGKKHCIGSPLTPSCVLSCLHAKQVTPHTLHRLSSQTRVTRRKSG